MKATQLARYLVLLISAFLTFFGIATLMNLGSHPDMMGWYTVYALLAFVEAAILLVCYFLLKKRNKRIFWLAIIILALNAILTIFDQIGVVDILFILLNLIALVVLYTSRKEFLPE
jgi:uncharacterized membrane protein